eukprot:5376921-Heterocapsa_arctica.AAC.1
MSTALQSPGLSRRTLALEDLQHACWSSARPGHTSRSSSHCRTPSGRRSCSASIGVVHNVHIDARHT